MSDPESKFTPTLKSQPGLKLQVPHTAEGREFLEKLKALLGGKELPFVQACPPTTSDTAKAVPGHKGGSTTYALELRLEQEGWPP